MKTWTLLVLFLVACTPAAKEGEACERDTSSFFGGRAGNCEDELVCAVSDDCTGTCGGHCRRLCTTNADCQPGGTCNGEISPENGGGRSCRGVPGT